MICAFEEEVQNEFESQGDRLHPLVHVMKNRAAIPGLITFLMESDKVLF